MMSLESVGNAALFPWHKNGKTNYRSNKKKRLHSSSHAQFFFVWCEIADARLGGLAIREHTIKTWTVLIAQLVAAIFLRPTLPRTSSEWSLAKCSRLALTARRDYRCNTSQVDAAQASTRMFSSLYLFHVAAKSKEFTGWGAVRLQCVSAAYRCVLGVHCFAAHVRTAITIRTDCVGKLLYLFCCCFCSIQLLINYTVCVCAQFQAARITSLTAAAITVEGGGKLRNPENHCKEPSHCELVWLQREAGPGPPYTHCDFVVTNASGCFVERRKKGAHLMRGKWVR